MGKIIDRAGHVFGRLTAISYAGKRNRHSLWLFRCECGGEKVIAAGAVVAGAVRSCGCLHRERNASGLNSRRHGDARMGRVTRLHNIWRGMHKRCKPSTGPEKYVSRGIQICDEWRDYPTFKAWAVLAGYDDSLSIDRIDNDGNYTPDNCRWATQKEQARNRRSSRILTVDGVSQTMAAWSEASGTPVSTMSYRILRGWDLKDAIWRKPLPLPGRPRKAP